MQVVIPSVNYADFLSVTLPAWTAMLPEARITVVTSPSDQATQDVAREHGARVYVTDIWSKNDAILNVGGALDKAFGFSNGRQPGVGERCLSVNADTYPCGTFPTHRLSRYTLYGCARYLVDTPEALQDHIAGKVPVSELAMIFPRQKGEPEVRVATQADAARAARRCLGYFQLFRYRPGLKFGHSRTAGGYDVAFRDWFSQRVALESFYVLHLGGIARSNWGRRVLPQWGAR